MVPLLSLIYINGLSGDLSSKAELLADDKSLFSVTHDKTTQAFNASFHEKLESIQYNACLALTIRGTSKEKIYQGLGLESLQIRLRYLSLL